MLTALATAGRNPADLTLPTAGTQATDPPGGGHEESARERAMTMGAPPTLPRVRQATPPAGKGGERIQTMGAGSIEAKPGMGPRGPYPPPSLDDVQTALDVAGVLDPTGASDLASAGISVYKEDYTGAAISVGAIFGLDFLKGLKRFKKLGKAADEAADVAKGAAKQADEAAPLVKQADEAVAEAKAADAAASAPKGLGPDDAIPEGFSFDIDNPTYRRLKDGDRVLEYSLKGEELAVDWVEGGGAASMLKRILATEDAGVRRISGYATEKLAGLSDNALLRYVNQVAASLGEGWKVSIRFVDGKRYLEFTR